MRTRLLAALAAASLAGLMATSPAGADIWDSPVANGTTNGKTTTVDITAGKPGQSITGLGIPRWLQECSWDDWTLLEKETHYGQWTGAQPTYQSLRSAKQNPDELWAVIYCRPGPEATKTTPQIIATGVLTTWKLGDTPPRTFIDWLVATAQAQLTIPVGLQQAAPAGTPDIPLITQLPTWLWVEPEDWTPISATTPSVFGYTATVTATPTNLTFIGADNNTINCGNNQAPAYNFNLEDHQQHSDCTLTYKHSSNVGDWTLTTKTTWTISYTCNPNCGTGTLPDIVINDTTPVTVAEIQAILIG